MQFLARAHTFRASLGAPDVRRHYYSTVRIRPGETGYVCVRVRPRAYVHVRRPAAESRECAARATRDL